MAPYNAAKLVNENHELRFAIIKRSRKRLDLDTKFFIRTHIIHIMKIIRVNTLSGTAVIVLLKFASRSISQWHHFIKNARL